MKVLGVLGGFGPETTAKFYMSVVDKNRNLSGSHPDIVIHNSPVPFELERDAVRDSKNLELFRKILVESTGKLQETDFIVLPCNTLHAFISDIRRASDVPVLSITEETAHAASKAGFKKIGILGTETTIRRGLIESEMSRAGIECVKPSGEDQKRLSEIIYDVLRGTKTEDNRKEIIEIIKHLEAQGAQAAILGCTDIQLVVSQRDSDLPLIDTMDVLASASVEIITGRRSL